MVVALATKSVSYGVCGGRATTYNGVIPDTVATSEISFGGSL